MPGSSVADLDPKLLADWMATVRARNPGGLGRFGDDVELLRRGGVTTAGERFIDTAIRFTVILRRGPSATRKPVIRGRSAPAVWDAIDAEKSVDEFRARTELSTANVRRILRDLRGGHFIAVNGGQGRPTTYRRVAE